MDEAVRFARSVLCANSQMPKRQHKIMSGSFWVHCVIVSRIIVEFSNGKLLPASKYAADVAPHIVSERTVMRLIKHLEQDGQITIDVINGGQAVVVPTRKLLEMQEERQRVWEACFFRFING